jgi:hypothetical protein
MHTTTTYAFLEVKADTRSMALHGEINGRVACGCGDDTAKDAEKINRMKW